MKAEVYIIAEAGVNHNGSVEIAKKLIRVAKDCGADAIKFQTFKAEKLVSKNTPKARYQMENDKGGSTQFEMLKKLELNPEDFIELKKYCEETGIDFLSSPFDEASCDFLEEIGVTSFKIGSGEITNIPFLKHIAHKCKPIILSTGMSTLGEVKEALSAIYNETSEKVSLLHCVTEYPAPFDQINLTAMQTLKNVFKVPVGYSDHTVGIEIALAAVAMGAEIIEKHFTLDKSMEGPDHKASIEPSEFKSMVLAIRNIESALGDGIKKPAKCEIPNMQIARKSLHLSKNINKGDIIRNEDLVMKRPGSGLGYQYIDFFTGKKAKRDLEEDTRIQLLDVE